MLRFGNKSAKRAKHRHRSLPVPGGWMVVAGDLVRVEYENTLNDGIPIHDSHTVQSGVIAELRKSNSWIKSSLGD